MSLLSSAQMEFYRKRGHLTVPGVFAPQLMDEIIDDIERWGEKVLADLPPGQRAWYVDGGVKARTVLRKLDNPHHQREAVRRLAFEPRLVQMVECLIGTGVSVYFSQIFFKPPQGGAPKPAHQDNYYFGPDNPEALVTAWIALDDATLENGCLYYAEGTHRGPVYPHVTPPDEPYNLQLPAVTLAQHPATPAPVPRGGVSFHHGNTFHHSGPNLSKHWRRACALHYVGNATVFDHPALPYNHALKLRIT